METKKRKYVEQIQKQYEPEDFSKVDEIRQLDKKVKCPAQVLAYILGSAGTLLLGTGMCLAMQVIGDTLSYGMALGIVIGLMGILMMSITYTIYKVVLRSRKLKYSEQIVALSNEVLNQ